jgi:Fe-S cluster assembly iron-binding protein IscA
MPLFSVLTASYLYSLFKEGSTLTKKVFLGIQYFILSLVFIACVFTCFFIFKTDSYSSHIWKIALGILIAYYCLKREDYYYRIITLGALSSVLINGILNAHFYPSLLEYQAGSTMAATIKENNISVDSIYKISANHTWALDFYNKKPVKISSIKALEKKKDVWVYVNQKELKELNASGLDWDRQLTEKQFRITRLQGRFLNPNTRNKVIKEMHLIHLY